MLRRFRSTCKGKRRGQAYTELLMVLSGVVFLTMLAWEFSYYWWGRMTVSTATFEAARQVAAGEPAADGYALYDEMLSSGMGRMADDHRGGFSMIVQPRFRSVYARADVPYHWPTGLGVLMGVGNGADMDLTLKASAFFRLERIQLGAPDVNRFE